MIQSLRTSYVPSTVSHFKLGMNIIVFVFKHKTLKISRVQRLFQGSLAWMHQPLSLLTPKHLWSLLPPSVCDLLRRPELLFWSI